MLIFHKTWQNLTRDPVQCKIFISEHCSRGPSPVAAASSVDWPAEGDEAVLQHHARLRSWKISNYVHVSVLFSMHRCTQGGAPHVPPIKILEKLPHKNAIKHGPPWFSHNPKYPPQKNLPENPRSPYLELWKDWSDFKTYCYLLKTNYFIHLNSWWKCS